MGINRAAEKVPGVFVSLVNAVADFLFASPQRNIVSADAQDMRERRAP